MRSTTCRRTTCSNHVATPARAEARDLLVHNIFHEKQHTGQVWNIRDELRLLQGWGNAGLYPLLVDLSRAQLISSLFGLTDDQLAGCDATRGRLDRPPDDRACARQRTPL